jgi:hypothetical protein
MGLFNKEEKKVASGTPTSQVINLRKQNLSDNQIIQNLQRDGYSSEQIFNAMSQADVKGGIEKTPPKDPASKNTDIPPPMPEQQPPPPPQQQSQPQQKQQDPPMPQEPPQNNSNIDANKVEEIVESIIDEKWDELVISVNKIIEWKNSMDNKISEIEEKTQNIQDQFEKLHKSLINKVDEYDKNMDNVSSELKAMNQVFQKILPTFTDNIQTLSRITEKLSKKSPSKKKSKK